MSSKRVRIVVVVLALCSPASAWAGESGRYAYDVLADKTYGATWKQLTAKLTKADRWATSAKGPSSPSRAVAIDGADYELVYACKLHDCGDNKIRVLFGDGGRTAVGLLLSPRGEAFLGEPTPAQKEILRQDEP